jgi:glycerol-3-phosphate dehydrogenase
VTPDTVTLVHRGVVPAEPDRRGQPTLKKRADVIDHARDGAPGLITMIGVKYTTARATAERAVDLAQRTLHTRRRPCRTSSEVLPGASIADHEALAIETERRVDITLDPRTRERLVSLYGARAVGIIHLAAEEAALAQPLASQTAAIGAEVVHAVRHEAARRLDDVIMRRTGLGAARWPGDAVVARASDLLARELRWSDAERAAEVDRLRDLYRVPRS